MGERAAADQARPARGGGGACAAEFAAYLSCLDAQDGKEEACRAPREALSRCMYAAKAAARQNASKHKVPINYHLQKVPTRPAPMHLPRAHPPPGFARCSLSRASRGDQERTRRRQCSTSVGGGDGWQAGCSRAGGLLPAAELGRKRSCKHARFRVGSIKLRPKILEACRW